MITRVKRLGLAFAVAASALLVAAPSASATFSNLPDQTWMTNGIVYSVVQSGNTVYVGGKFRALRRCPTGVSCPNGTIQTVQMVGYRYDYADRNYRLTGVQAADDANMRRQGYRFVTANTSRTR